MIGPYIFKDKYKWYTRQIKPGFEMVAYFKSVLTEIGSDILNNTIVISSFLSRGKQIIIESYAQNEEYT